jgi:hypothetical protein
MEASKVEHPPDNRPSSVVRSRSRPSFAIAGNRSKTCEGSLGMAAAVVEG